ncbi:MAG: hypothetical protein ACI9RM_002350, partial [Ulvibacter sp.]
ENDQASFTDSIDPFDVGTIYLSDCNLFTKSIHIKV